MEAEEREDPVEVILADARATASLHEPAQLDRVAFVLGRPVDDVSRRLLEVVDRVEIRVTRGLAIGRHLFDEMAAGRIPTIRSLFETGRQDHSSDPERIAAVVAFRRDREEETFAHRPLALREEDRPKYGFAYFEGTPTEPIPFGPVCFLLDLDSSDLRMRTTFTPVDSSTDGITRDEVGTLDHPLNAFARSSDALRASGLLAREAPLPRNCGLRHNAEEGVPEAQIWGPLPVTADNVRAIIVEVFVRDLPRVDDLRAVADRQGIPLVVRVIEGGR